jgi:hypothetical protein
VNGSTHPPNHRPHDRPRPNLGGRPCKRVQIFDPLLVPLDPENERAALIALAVLLAPASASDAGDSTPAANNDNHDPADNGQEGEADL